MPALLNAMSSRPASSAMRAMSAETSLSSATSAFAVRALPPACTMSSRVSPRLASCRPAQYTSAPRAANARAASRPMPEPAPVTSTTRSSKAPCIGQLSAELDQIQRRQYAAWKLLQPRCAREIAQVDGGEARLLEDLAHGAFGSGIISRDEQDPVTACDARISREHGAHQCVRRLDHPRTGRMRSHDLARSLPVQLGEPQAAGGRDGRVRGIDQDAAAPGRQTGKRFGDLLPAYGELNDIRLRGFFARAGPATRTQLLHRLCQRLGPAAVAQDHLVAGLHSLRCEGLPDAAGADDSNLHVMPPD